MNQKLGQLFMIGIQGPSLLEEETQFIVKNNIGGIILFGRNLRSPQQIFDLCKEIQSLKKQTSDQIPFFIGIDMEGGRVHRLKEPFTQWPSFGQLAHKKSLIQAFHFAESMGLELRTCGINLNFSPCLDVLANPKNDLIGDRSFSSHPEEVTKMASEILRGFTQSQVIACAKHFPGHGNTIIDSHEDLPIDETDLETLKKRELIPFQALFKSKLKMVMTAHIKYKKVDELPATISYKILTQILRNQLNYKEIIISDDLDMKALSNYYNKKDIPIKALNAGCDILLYCNEPSSPLLAMESCQKALEKGIIDSKKIEASYERIINLKKSLSVNENFQPKLIGCSKHMKLAEEIRNTN